ncbi:MAG: hypothetical protein C5B52_18710 [Bacteroidetes bacterium]|nr:MAG: hypothetical protein C5B52_18710 [Bacteroidota bacterium]
MSKWLFITFLLTSVLQNIQAQDAKALVNKVREKLEKVNDYEAMGTLKTDVAFLKVPESNVNIFFKKPDHFKIRKEGGISIMPKGGVSINLNSMLVTDDFTAVPAGNSTIGNSPVTVVKLIPLSDNSDVVLTTMYIDEKNLLIRKAITTTKENGTYEMELTYGKYSEYGLPDKVVFVFNTKDYKIPKGVTFEYEEDQPQGQNAAKTQNKKGRLEISYKSYTINKGISDSVFK